jgi:DNA-binding MarR family transcriptional regulator
MSDILNTVARYNSWKRSVNTALRPLGITLDQALTILTVAEKGPQTMGALADELHLSRGVLTGLVERIELGGLVGTIRPESDKRTVVVSLTAAGDALATQIKVALDQLQASAA